MHVFSTCVCVGERKRESEVWKRDHDTGKEWTCEHVERERMYETSVTEMSMLDSKASLMGLDECA
jgi:hypothetical protein